MYEIFLNKIKWKICNIYVFDKCNLLLFFSGTTKVLLVNEPGSSICLDTADLCDDPKAEIIIC